MKVLRLTALVAIAMIAAAATPPPAAASPPVERAAPTAPPVSIEFAIAAPTLHAIVIDSMYELASSPMIGHVSIAVSRTIARDSIAPTAEVLLVIDRLGRTQRPLHRRQSRHTEGKSRSRAAPLTSYR